MAMARDVAGLAWAGGEADAREQLVAEADALLPQTQCRRCGYGGCAPYAEALVHRQESHLLCPPGGPDVALALAQLLGRETAAAALMPEAERRTAYVVEADCIGCTKCIQACPVDAIVGASGMLHAVVAQWCTGCDLCAPVCPTDCIAMLPPAVAAPAPSASRARFDRRKARAAAAPVSDYEVVDAAQLDLAARRNAVSAAVARRRRRLADEA